MAKDDRKSAGNIDPESFAQNMIDITMQSQKLMQQFFARRLSDGPGDLDPLNVMPAFRDLAASMMTDPAKLIQAQSALWQQYGQLWQYAANRMMGKDAEPVVAPDPSDRRFKNAAWQDELVFDYIKQSYLLTARWLEDTIGQVDDLDDKAAHKTAFYTRQFVNAMSPTNFAATNPEVIQATLDSKGQNLLDGLQNLMEDLEAGEGQLKIKMIEPDAFEVGKDVATTPGEVVFRNDLMELIQYQPTTEKVHKRPLLVIPPWINKYYILDLRPENSFVKWAVDSGHTVFMISWVNPDEKLAAKGFEDYLNEGPLAALAAIEQAAGETEVNAVGLCLGGILLSTALSYLTEKGEDRIKSATFMATNLDFTEPGDLGVFLDEEQVDAIEEKMAAAGGYLDASAMASAFNMLRSNDLIWSFVVNNYLLGKDPFPFDLLFWNADSTRMPAAMQSFYLRNICLANKLVQPGGIELSGTKIDLTKVETPVYIAATKEDHIAPWQSAYKATQIYGGPVRFVLGGSGHIAGVTNAPPNAKYGHWTNSKLPKTAEAWLEGAKEHKDSWWLDWQKWVKKYLGAGVAARVPGDGKLKPIVPAPGTYVLEKAA